MSKSIHGENDLPNYVSSYTLGNDVSSNYISKSHSKNTHMLLNLVSTHTTARYTFHHQMIAVLCHPRNYNS